MPIAKKDKIYVLLQFLLFLLWLVEIGEMHFELSPNLRTLALLIAGVGLIIVWWPWFK